MARDVGPGPGPVLLPPLSQADLASLVAGTRQRVNVALRELVRDGLICHDGRRITVCDVESLARQLRW
jgi:predicted transcriptional regulator